MALLLTGVVLFFGVHSVAIVADGWRARTVRRFGERAWKAAYALVALAGLVLIVSGYGQARLDPAVLYTPPVWLRHLNFLLMMPVFPLLLAAYLPGRISAAARHPMLAATTLWASAHLLANGSLADVLLFGAFLVWAVADWISLKRRAARPVPGAPPSARNDVIAVIAGLVLYIGFLFHLHRWLIGVPLLGAG